MHKSILALPIIWLEQQKVVRSCFLNMSPNHRHYENLKSALSLSLHVNARVARENKKSGSEQHI